MGAIAAAGAARGAIRVHLASAQGHQGSWVNTVRGRGEGTPGEPVVYSVAATVREGEFRWRWVGWWCIVVVVAVVVVVAQGA